MPKPPTTLLEVAGVRGPVTGSGTSGVRNRSVPTHLIAGPYRGWADPPQFPVDLNRGRSRDLASVLRVPASVATAIVRARRGRPFETTSDLGRVPGIGPARLAKARFAGMAARSPHPTITSLRIGPDDHILSGRAYTLSIGFVPSYLAPVEVADLTIFWEGAPYRVQRALTRKE